MNEPPSLREASANALRVSEGEDTKSNNKRKRSFTYDLELL